MGAQDGYLYALNPNGTLAWRFAAASPVQQHPVVGSDGTVYIGMDGRLYAFSPGGEVRWTASLGTASLPGGPALAPDGQTIYAFGYDSAGPVATLYAFRLDGTTKWQFSNFYGYYPALSPPTVAADGTVIVLSGQLVAIGPDGVEKWRYEPSASYYSSYASVAVNPAGEVVFAVRLVSRASSNAQRGASSGSCNSSVASTMNELESTYSAPLIDASGNIFLGLGTGKRWTRPWGKVLRAYTPAGTLLWEFPVGEGVYTSSPALAPDGTLYVGSMDGALYALQDAAPAPNTIASLSVSPQSLPGGTVGAGHGGGHATRGCRWHHGPALGRPGGRSRCRRPSSYPRVPPRPRSRSGQASSTLRPWRPSAARTVTRPAAPS